MQMLLAKLSVEIVRDYLESSGWHEVQGAHPERIYFEGPVHDGGKPYELWIPASIRQPRARSRIQNTLFALSCIEDREPRDIAQEMITRADMIARAPSPEKPSTESLFLRNNGTQAMALSIPQRGITIELAADEECRIEFVDKNEVPSGVELSRGRIRVRGSNEVTLRLRSTSASSPR